MNKVKSLSLDQQNASAIATAVFVYAEAAYPPGGSECAQATNQGLKQLSIAFSNAHQVPVTLKKRQLPMIKAAIRWFYGDDNPIEHDHSIQPEALIELLE